MESDCFVDVEQRSTSDELIGLILSTQKHTLTEEDRRILASRETLQNQLVTLQNAEHSIPEDTKFIICDVEAESAETENDATRLDTHDFELLLKSAELNNSRDTNQIVDECIIKYIPEIDIKDNIVAVNALIAENDDKRQSVVVKAKKLFLERKQLERKLARVKERIQNYSAKEKEIRRVRRKKGPNCAITTGPMKSTYFIRFGIPYFKSTYRYPCEANSDLRYLKSIGQVYTYNLPPKRRFQPQRMTEFDKHVLAQLRQKRISKLERNLKELLAQKDKSKFHEQCRTIEQEIVRTRKVNDLRDTIDWNINVNFQALPELPTYSRDDFERLWNLVSKPTLSREEFTEEEMEKLCNLVDKHGAQDWDRLAELLGTNRSGFVCFTKYAMKKPHSKYIPWTAEENELLLELCRPMQGPMSNGDRGRLWNIVCSNFPNRSAHSLHAHWSYHLNPIWKKGKFTEDEHKRVVELHEQGKSYTEISKMLGNRSSKQIRSHLEGAALMKTTIGMWTDKEDELLLKAVKKLGESSWKQVADRVKTRTRHQCRLRYVCLQKGESGKPKCKRDYWSPKEEALLAKLLKKYGHKYYLISRCMENRTARQVRYKCYKKMPKCRDQVEPLQDEGIETCAEDDEAEEPASEKRTKHDDAEKLADDGIDTCAEDDRTEKPVSKKRKKLDQVEKSKDDGAEMRAEDDKTKKPVSKKRKSSVNIEKLKDEGIETGADDDKAKKSVGKKRQKLGETEKVKDDETKTRVENAKTKKKAVNKKREKLAETEKSNDDGLKTRTENDEMKKPVGKKREKLAKTEKSKNAGIKTRAKNDTTKKSASSGTQTRGMSGKAKQLKGGRKKKL